MDDKSQRVHVLISGKVHGVCFRMYTSEEARGRGLVGWVRNLSDGRVELIAEGSREELGGLVEWCRSGSPWARVERLEVEWGEATAEYGGFRTVASAHTPDEG